MVEDNLAVADHRIKVRYQDPTLADSLGRAMRHLRSASPSVPALTIDCWTATEPLPGLPPTESTGTMYAEGCDGRALSWDGHNGPLYAYDRSRRHAWVRFSAPAEPTPWDRAAPFRPILRWWASEQGLQPAHAAAVGTPDGGVLLVGPGGSGKSTTSLACLEAGLSFAGDDACLISDGEPPFVHGLYLSAKGDANTAALLPGCRNDFTQSALIVDDESVLFADRIRPESISAGFPLRAVLVLRLGGSVSRLSPLSTAAGLRALAPSTVLQTPGNRAGGLSRLGGIVRKLPIWELAVGPVPSTAASLIRELLKGPHHA